MAGRRILLLMILLAAGSLWSGCGGGYRAKLLPVLMSISPSTAAAGGAGFTLTVDGSRFSYPSVVRWNGDDRPTTYVSGNQLTAVIPASDIAAGGTAQVTVFNPGPGGGSSAGVTFTITLPPPVLTRLSPLATDAGDPDRVLTVNGSNFSGQSVVRWNGKDLVTTFLSDTALQARATAADLAVPGTAAITVFETAPGGGTSGSVDFLVMDPAAPPVGVIDRMSIADDGSVGSGSGSFGASISADGRYVAFASGADNLVAGDTNGFADIFLRDTCIGAAGCTPSTTRVSVASDGTESNDDSGGPSFFSVSISADGRFVAFESFASNLVPGDTNGVGDIFIRDTCLGAAGCTPSTSRVSVGDTGIQGNAASLHPSFSADGRYVAFDSPADNLVAGDTNGVRDVFVRDTCFAVTGCTASTTRVSVATDGTQGDGDSLDPSITADGRYVAYESLATSLVGSDTNARRDIFVRDTCFGATGCTPSTTRISVATDGTQANNRSMFASISADGRAVAFVSDATNLVANVNDGFADDIFVRDTCIGATGCTPSTFFASLTTDGTQANNGSFFLSISADGRFVAFDSFATNLDSGDTNNVSDVFVRDTCLGATGCSPSTARISVTLNGDQGNNLSVLATLTAHGRLVAFESPANNLVPGNNNGFGQVFLARTGF